MFPTPAEAALPGTTDIVEVLLLKTGAKRCGARMTGGGARESLKGLLAQRAGYALIERSGALRKKIERNWPLESRTEAAHHDIAWFILGYEGHDNDADARDD